MKDELRGVACSEIGWLKEEKLGEATGFMFLSSRKGVEGQDVLAANAVFQSLSMKVRAFAS